jgi:hypothetical protein
VPSLIRRTAPCGTGWVNSSPLLAATSPTGQVGGSGRPGDPAHEVKIDIRAPMFYAAAAWVMTTDFSTCHATFRSGGSVQRTFLSAAAVGAAGASSVPDAAHPGT